MFKYIRSKKLFTIGGLESHILDRNPRIPIHFLMTFLADR